MAVTSNLTNYSDIIQNVADQSNTLTDIIAQLRSSNSMGKILERTVDSVRQAIKCDRVVIYSLQASERGKIVAESVASQFPKTLNTTIVDPCFEARYLDQYQMGRVRAIANIQQAGMSSCYVDNLEKIGVKANLVVPIITGADQLYGLLVLHQCSDFYQWQSTEIDLCIQVAAQVGYALAHLTTSIECTNLRQKLQQINEWHELLPIINKKLYTCNNRLEVLQIAVSETQRLLQCDRVVIYSLQANSMGKIAAEVTKPSLAPILGRTMVDPCFEHRYIEKYQNGRVRAIDDIHNAGMTECYVESLDNIGVKSNLVAPMLFDNGILLGLLVAHSCFEYRQWQSVEVERVRQIAMQAGMALTNARMREKRDVMKSATKTLTDAENNLRLAVKANVNMQVAEDELAGVIQEMRNLSGLLEKETMESGEKTAAEAQRLLNMLANTNRLQGHVDRLQANQKNLEPQRQQLAQILTETLKSIENCPL
jgi:GAF domain-containing protein